MKQASISVHYILSTACDVLQDSKMKQKKPPARLQSFLRGSQSTRGGGMNRRDASLQRHWSIVLMLLLLTDDLLARVCLAGKSNLTASQVSFC